MPCAKRGHAVIHDVDIEKQMQCQHSGRKQRKGGAVARKGKDSAQGHGR